MTDRIVSSVDPDSLLALLDKKRHVGFAGAPFTVLADALDEAQEPQAIAEFLAELGSGNHHARVIIGTRRSTGEGPDTQPDPAKRGSARCVAGTG